MGHSADHRKARDPDCRWAEGHDCRWEEGRDCRWAKDVAVACRAGQKRQPQAGQLLADLAAVGRAKRDAARAKRQYCFVPLGAKAVRAELGARVSVRMTVGPETLRERMDVELLELQAVLLLKERASALRGQQGRMWELVSTVRLARKRVQWRLAPGAFESR